VGRVVRLLHGDRLAGGSRNELCDRTFGHAVQAAQITPLCDADTEVIMLSIESIREEVRERLRCLDSFSARPSCSILLRRCDSIRCAWKVHSWFWHRNICRDTPRQV
jgi:hypothetical protein